MKPYLIRTQVRDFNLEWAEAITARIIDEWHFRVHSFEVNIPYLEFVGDGLMALDEDLFVDRIALAAWAANEGPWEVRLQLYDLEAAPFNAMRRDNDAHERWLSAQTWQIGQVVNVSIDNVSYLCQLARIVPDGVYVRAACDSLPSGLLRRKLSPMRGEVTLAAQLEAVEVQHG